MKFSVRLATVMACSALSTVPVNAQMVSVNGALASAVQVTKESDSKADFGWREITTKHFVIYSDVAEDKARSFAERMERFDGAIRQIVGAQESIPVTIYLVSDIEEVQRLAGRKNIGGFYSGAAQGPYLVAPLKAYENNTIRDTARTILFHEYGHHMTLGNSSEFYPGWVTEGLAEFFSTADFGADGSVTLGAPNTMRTYDIGGMNRWNVEQLLTSDSREIPSNQRIERYTRGWLLCHYLLVSGKRNGQLSAYVKKINEGADALTAGKEVFGDLKQLNVEIERYVKQSTLPGLTFIPDSVKGGIPLTVRRLTEGQAKIMPARLRSAIGVNEETAPKVAAQGAAIAAQYPNDPFVQRAMAEMAYDTKQYDQAIAAADRALAAEPNNLMAVVYKGRSLAKVAQKEKDAAKWKQARGQFVKANKLDPNHALPFVLYYDSFAASGETPPEAAFTGLLRAKMIVPQDDSINLRIGYALIQKGDLAWARKALAPVGFNPERGEKNPAKMLILAIDEGKTTQEIQELAKKVKLNEVNEFTEKSPEDEKQEFQPIQ